MFIYLKHGGSGCVSLQSQHVLWPTVLCAGGSDVQGLVWHLSILDNKQTLVNTNCPVILLLEHIKAKVGLSKTELVDLCDEGGDLKLLFLSQQPQECACLQLTPRCSFIVCSVYRSRTDGAYVSISPLLASPDPALLETLQNQTDSLEKARLMQLRSLENCRCQVKGPGRTVHLDTAQEKPLRKIGGRRRS